MCDTRLYSPHSRTHTLLFFIDIPYMILANALDYPSSLLFRSLSLDEVDQVEV